MLGIEGQVALQDDAVRPADFVGLLSPHSPAFDALPFKQIVAFLVVQASDVFGVAVQHESDGRCAWKVTQEPALHFKGGWERAIMRQGRQSGLAVGRVPGFAGFPGFDPLF
jgi:hypothetical protein